VTNEFRIQPMRIAAAARRFADNLNYDIAPGDAMFGGNHDHYFGVGASALSNILHALAVTDTTPARILDFGCGAGRVTRWLRSAFPSAAIEGCDIREADLQFVAGEFDVRTWVSGTDVSLLKPPSSYDLIWVGSVFTHLPMRVSVELFDKLASWLNPAGVLVFTSHGRHVSALGEQSNFYGIPDDWSRVLSEYRNRKYGYADYAQTPGYGISVTQLSWWAELVSSRSNLRLITMYERGWDDHQACHSGSDSGNKVGMNKS
jgi:SAM-dependent methyltransferase